MIKPTRLGHANMFVTDVEKSIAFYNDVAGIELVRREPEISIAFHSNGNTHHDVGLVQVAPGQRLGIDGFVQVSSNRATKPGLNHLGWEVRSEAVLIDALRRITATGHPIKNSANHQIAHSAYLVDPAGTYHEFYADTIERWRTIFNLDHEELVTEAWDWENAGAGLGPMPGDPADRRRVEQALFHPRRIMYATLAVPDFRETLDFLTNVAGLSAVTGDGIALLHGAKSPLDLIIVSTEHGYTPGLQAISFVIEDEDDLLESIKAATARGVDLVTSLDLPHKRGVVVADPDGVMVEFHFRRQPDPVVPRPDKQSAWLFSA